MSMSFPGARALVLATLIATTSGCAYSYHTIDPKRITYGNEETSHGVALRYRYNVLTEAGNNRYGNKERRKALSVMAVSLTNKTDSAITITPQSIRLSMGGQGLQFVPAAAAADQLHQTVWPHIFWLLLTFNVVEKDQRGNTHTKLVLPIGLPISAINLIQGSQANRKLRENLETQALTERRLAPGETTYGLVTLRDVGYNPVQFELMSADGTTR